MLLMAYLEATTKKSKLPAILKVLDVHCKITEYLNIWVAWYLNVRIQFQICMPCLIEIETYE